MYFSQSSNGTERKTGPAGGIVAIEMALTYMTFGQFLSF